MQKGTNKLILQYHFPILIKLPGTNLQKYQIFRKKFFFISSSQISYNVMYTGQVIL